MKINHFKATKLHGYLSFRLAFNEGLTFLTGINGSGKTSAVRALTALLTPSLSTLSNMDYESVAVEVEHQDALITISSRRTKDSLLLECSGISRTLKLPLLAQEVYETRTRFLDRQVDFYREQEALNHSNPVLAAIAGLPTPMFLDLERRNQDSPRLRRDLARPGPRVTASNPLAGSLTESLLEAENVAEQSYRAALSVKAQFTDALKQDIILTAFRPEQTQPGEPRTNWLRRRQPLLKEIRKNESVVRNSLLEIGISEHQLDELVAPFFERARSILKALPTEKTLEKDDWYMDSTSVEKINAWSAIEPQIQQTQRLVELIDSYNVRVREALAQVDGYLQLVNSFLADSEKAIFFTKAANLRVSINGVLEGAKSVTGLSSGERQLFVILTHLAMNKRAQRSNILIIDEPELSLHLRWQELFVDAVLSASSNLQLILATHSPSIIKGRNSQCIDVREGAAS